MDAKQAWQATLDQLQMDIPKPTFDKWVRDTQFIAYEEGVMTLGFQDSYVRDWVEARLSSMIRRILVGIFACEVSLRFEIITPVRSSDEVGMPQHSGGDRDTDNGNEEILVQLDTTRQSLYEVMVQPERVTVIPGYFLRWLPYLGYQRGWMIVALWQIFFQTCGHKARPGKPFMASGAEIARWAGLSRRTVVTHLNELGSPASDSYLAWFLERVKSQEANSFSGQATRFRFRATLPLTPGDANKLSEKLCQLGITENPVAALQAALTRQPKELLPFPAPNPSEPYALREPTPTVQQIVLNLARVTPKHAQYAEILQLAGELAGRLMPPKDVLVISHYFLLNWLPLLGSGPGWLVTLLRDEGYYDRKTGELRDKIRLEEGYAELARRLGLERENTVGDWLPTPLKRQGPEKKGKGERQTRRDTIRNYVSLFLTKTNFHIDHTGKQKTVWELQLKMAEPLISEHQQIHEGLLAAVQDALHRCDRTKLDWLLDGRQETTPADCTGQVSVATRFAQASPRDLHPSTYGQHAFCSGTPRELHTRSGTSPRALHTLKHLINQHFFKAQTSIREVLTTAYQPPTSDTPHKAAEGDHSGGKLWDFDRLLALEGTSARRRMEICKKIAVRPTLGTQFLAWLLYAYHHRKTADRKTGIESPFGYALSRYEKLLPSSEYMALANLPPDELGNLFLHPYTTWDLPKTTQNLLKEVAQNGFLVLIQEMCENPTN